VCSIFVLFSEDEIRELNLTLSEIIAYYI